MRIAIVTSLVEMENKLLVYLQAIDQISQEVEDVTNDSYVQATSNDTKISNILSVIGSKPRLIDRRHDAPDIWSVIGSIVDEVRNKISLQQYEVIKK